MHNLFIVKLSLIDAKTFDKLITLLPVSEKERILKFKNKKSAADSLVAALLVRYALKETFDLSYDEIEIVRTKNGKPCLKGNQDIHFNISHSDELVVCIVSDKPVGIDVQKIKPVPLSVINRVCSEEELKSNLSSSEFIKLWTMKEAVLKRNGTGILDSEIRSCTKGENLCSFQHEDYWISYTL